MSAFLVICAVTGAWMAWGKNGAFVCLIGMFAINDCVQNDTLHRLHSAEKRIERLEHPPTAEAPK